jgi:hypothetical protein
MTLFFAKSTLGFYDTEINEAVPADAVEITKAEWDAVMVGQLEGKCIGADENGRPALVDPPVWPAPDPVPVTDKLAALGIDVAELRTLLTTTTT